MGTSSSEGEGDYLMPWSRVLNWNRLPGELSSSLFLRSPSPRRFTHFASFSFHRPSARPPLSSLPFFSFFIYPPSSTIVPPPPLLLLAFFVRSFLGGAERSLIADGRTSRPRDRIGNEGQKFADPPLYTGFRGRGKRGGEEARKRRGEGKREIRCRWRVTRCSYPRRTVEFAVEVARNYH